MAELIIEQLQQGVQKRVPHIFNIFVDGKPVGSISGHAPQLVLDVAAGAHTVQVRNGLLSGKSQILVVDVQANSSPRIQVTKNKALSFAFPLAFIAIYFALRVLLALPLPTAAGSALAVLCLAFALIPTIALTKAP